MHQMVLKFQWQKLSFHASIENNQVRFMMNQTSIKSYRFTIEHFNSDDSVIENNKIWIGGGKLIMNMVYNTTMAPAIHILKVHITIKNMRYRIIWITAQRTWFGSQKLHTTFVDKFHHSYKLCLGPLSLWYCTRNQKITGTYSQSGASHVWHV